MEEMADGRQVWSDMTATINGQESKVSACRQWGGFLLGGRMIVLDHYPLQALNIQIPPADAGGAAGDLVEAEPITEEKKITAKYRVMKTGDSRISFAPVQRVQQLDTGALTELVDIEINLNDKLRQDFGKMNVGDEKEFSLTVKVLIGFQPLGQGAPAVIHNPGSPQNSGLKEAR
jgi:hypothetical protein